jgi:ATP-dependent Clp protease ATP-binding subunit ClpC
VLAHQASMQLEDHVVGTEHILLGLVEEGEGVAARVLASLGVTADAVRNSVQDSAPAPGSPGSGSPPFTPRAKRALELSLRESLQLGNNYVGPEHMLLGLVQEGEGTAPHVLVSLGAELPRIRREVLALLEDQSAEDLVEGVGLVEHLPHAGRRWNVMSPTGYSRCGRRIRVGCLSRLRCCSSTASAAA